MNPMENSSFSNSNGSFLRGLVTFLDKESHFLDDDSPQSPLYSLFWYTVTLYYKQSTRSWVNGDTLRYSSSNKIYVAILYVTYITTMSCLGPKKANIPTKIPTALPSHPQEADIANTGNFPFSPLCPQYIPSGNLT